MAKRRTSKNKRRVARRSLRDVVRCDHYWNYEHSLWQAREGREEVAVGRYCGKCGKLETAVARNWHSLPKSYVDMRETMEASIKASNRLVRPLRESIVSEYKRHLNAAMQAGETCSCCDVKYLTDLPM